MKKIISIMLASIMMLALLTACGDSADSSATGSQKKEPATTSTEEKPEETKQESTDEGDLGDFHVKLLDVETGLKDYEGNPVAGVKYEFTNNSDESAEADIALYMQAFQDGVELESAIVEESSDEHDNASKEIKNGVTLTCEQYFVLTSETSDLEVEIAELVSFSDEKLTKTYEIKK